ncbi:hypothetical protein D6833_03240 [Candidatus Parcubacteria bacterium]|nr:MAG: hypothetical protein D6833_03240 [Candidatus Parcubacteria bacterium]
MNNIQKKFYAFKSGRLGRAIDITLGIVLFTIALQLPTLLAKGAVMLVALLAFTAGAFNVCWAAPVIGIPFKGNTKTS